MTTRKYSSRSQQTTLTSSITAGTTTMVVGSASALVPSGLTAGHIFTVVIDPDTAQEEIVDVSVVSTNTLTIARGIENAGTGQIHSAGAVVRHMVTGRDLREANLHIEATGAYNDGTATHAMHGIGSGEGDVVGTDKTQTLTAKTLTSPILTTPALGTPASGVLTNTTGYTAANLAGLGTGVATFLATPSSTNLRSALTDETGTGSAVFATSPTIADPTITGTGAIAGTFTGNLTGNVTGNVSGTAGSATGNAATATALQTARNFQLTGDVEASAVSFDGTGNVSLTTVIGTGAIVNADINASAAIDLSKLADATIKIETASYTLQLSDKNKFIKMNITSTANTVTVPLDSTVTFPEGAQIHIIQYGSGKTEIVGASGAVYIYRTPGSFLRAQYSSATLLKCAAANTWMLMGDLSAS